VKNSKLWENIPWRRVVLVLVVLLAGSYLMDLRAQNNGYDMAWAPPNVPAGEEVLSVKEQLALLEVPQQVVDMLSREELLACDGADWCAVYTKSFQEAPTPRDLRFTDVVLRMPEEGTYRLIHAFFWEGEERFYATEAIDLWDAASNGPGVSLATEVAGRVFYDEDGTTYAARYPELTYLTKPQPEYASFVSPQPGHLAGFSFPKKGENCRGYLTYSVRLGPDTRQLIAYVNYIHQTDGMGEPLTATEWIANGEKPYSAPFDYIQNRGVEFEVVDGALKPSEPDDGGTLSIYELNK